MVYGLGVVVGLGLVAVILYGVLAPLADAHRRRRRSRDHSDEGRRTNM